MIVLHIGVGCEGPEMLFQDSELEKVFDFAESHCHSIASVVPWHFHMTILRRS